MAIPFTPFIPVCGYCFADLEVLERDDNNNIISWICPECGEIEYVEEIGGNNYDQI